MNRNRRFNLLILLLKLYSGFIMLFGVSLVIVEITGLADLMDQLIEINGKTQSANINVFFYNLIGMLIFIMGILLLIMIHNGLEKNLFGHGKAYF